MREFIVTPLPEQDYTRRGRLPIESKLAIQARQSTKQQTEDNRESYESQTRAHYKRALRLGWRDDDILMFLENKRKDGKFIDASGTKRIDERPTMREIWYYIENDMVKALMTRGVDRLFRHVDMVEPAMFAKLCKEHHCLILTDAATLDLNRPDDYNKFLADAQAGADHLQHIKMMNRLKLEKSMRGEYDGRSIPVGFILDEDRMFYIIYEPHARVVRWLFRRYRELAGNIAMLKKEVAQKIATQGYLFPQFPESIQSRVILGGNKYGYTLTAIGLKELLTNVAYIGWWLVYETVDKGLPTEQKVLRAKIENNHPAIVDTVDFWYAHDRLTEKDAPRLRYHKVGTTPCDALLNGIVTSTNGCSVYVYQKSQEPESAVYVIEDTKETYNDHAHGSLYVKDLDRIFTNHLLAKLEEEKRQRQQLTGSDLLADLDGMENAMAVRLAAIAKMQAEDSAGLTASLAEYTQEADSLQRTLRYGAAKLDSETIEKFSGRLARLHVTIKELTLKQQRAQAAAAEWAEFTTWLEDVPAIWKEMGSENRRRFVRLVTEQVTLTKPAHNWLQLTIQWLWPDAPVDICFIWQRWGKGEIWSLEENHILHMLYPQADRQTILEALPNRSWSAINNQAHKLGILRLYQFNSSDLHRLLSLDDAAFMAQAGLAFNSENPYQRVWWIDTTLNAVQ